MNQLRFISCLLVAGLSAGTAAGQALTTTTGAAVTVENGAILFVEGGLVHNNGATLTNAGTLQLTGDLRNEGTLTNSGTLQLTGDLRNEGSLTSQGQLLFSGSRDQTFTPGSATVANLTVNNTGAAGQNRLLVAADLGIGTRLTLTQGMVRTLGNATLKLLTLSTILEGETEGRYVQGRLQASRFVNGGRTVTFPNSLTLPRSNQNLGTVTVTRTAGLQTAGVSYGQSANGTAKGIDRVWEITSENPVDASKNLPLILNWIADDDNGFDPAANAQLWRGAQGAGPWESQGAVAMAGSRSFTTTTNQLGVFTVSNASAPLPVTLVEFKAERRGDDALLRWKTASELNNAYFEVESSPDGAVFRPLGRVAGAGTSSAERQYQFFDAQLARYGTPLVYYRLRQVDRDGTQSYSPVQTVRVEAPTALNVYPSPVAAGQPVQVRGAGPLAALELLDALGRPVLTGRADAGGAAHLLLPAGLPTGAYVLRCGPQARRLIVQ